MKKLLITILFALTFTVNAGVTITGNCSYDTGSKELNYDVAVGVGISFKTNKLYIGVKGNNDAGNDQFSVLGKFKFISLAKWSWFNPYYIISNEVYLLDKGFANRFLNGVGIEFDVFPNWNFFNMSFETGFNMSFEKDTVINTPVIGWWRSRAEIVLNITKTFYFKADYVYAVPTNIKGELWRYYEIAGVMKFSDVISLIGSYNNYNYSILNLGSGSIYKIQIGFSL